MGPKWSPFSTHVTLRQGARSLASTPSSRRGRAFALRAVAAPAGCCPACQPSTQLSSCPSGDSRLDAGCRETQGQGHSEESSKALASTTARAQMLPRHWPLQAANSLPSACLPPAPQPAPPPCHSLTSCRVQAGILEVPVVPLAHKALRTWGRGGGLSQAQQNIHTHTLHPAPSPL